jgi:formylmethanofuran dehydrogenase subunit D
MKVEVTLVTGRTINQGKGSISGKGSELYKNETATIELGAGVFQKMGLDPGQMVQVSTAYGRGLFSARKAVLPDALAFIPYGPAANRLTSDETGGSGMPVYKGLSAWIRRDDNDSL